MLPDYLLKFNETLSKFQRKFPRVGWTSEFRDSLINDYSFYSARVEDSKLQYGDTIRFLNNESVRGINFNSSSKNKQFSNAQKDIFYVLNFLIFQLFN